MRYAAFFAYRQDDCQQKVCQYALVLLDIVYTLYITLAEDFFPGITPDLYSRQSSGDHWQQTYGRQQLTDQPLSLGACWHLPPRPGDLDLTLPESSGQCCYIRMRS